MQWLWAVQMQLFDGHLDVNNNRIRAAAAETGSTGAQDTYCMLCIEINLPQEKPFSFNRLKKIRLSK